MLVLTRFEGEAICITDDVIVTILEVNGKKVRIGIQAPKDMAVYRHEIWLRIKGESDAIDG